MQMQEEVDAGIERLRQRMKGLGKLEVVPSQPLSDCEAQYFVVASGQKKVDFVLSYEFLSDLPNTKEYLAFLEEYARTLENRFKQPNPMDFYCRDGTPINIEVLWPMPEYVRVSVEDIHQPTLVAKCVVYVDGTAFECQQAIVNRIRQAIDRQEITFYARAEHPDKLQVLEARSLKQPADTVTQDDLGQFLSGKVYWLGFKREGKDGKVWIADPWDADYLGVSTKELRQAAQIQEARGMLKLDPQDFATPGEGLLATSSSFEAQPKSAPSLVFLSGPTESLAVRRKLLRELLPDSVSVVTAGEEQAEGRIASDARSLIERADFAVFDVAEGRPNTFIEFGMAQALKKKLVLLVPKDFAAKLPFDVASYLYLTYDSQNPGSLKDSLSRYMERYWGLPVAS